MVKQDDAIEIGIEKAAVEFLAPGAGTAVHEQHRQPHDVAAFLDMEFMPGLDREPVRRIRVNFGEKLVQGSALKRFGFDLQVSGVDDAPEIIETIIVLVGGQIVHHFFFHLEIAQTLVIVFFHQRAK